MSGKPSFVLYGEIEDHLEDVSDEDCGKLFRAILQYANRREVMELGGEVKMAFRFIRAQLDRDLEKWNATSKERAKAGAKGGIASGKTRRDKEQQNEANEANALFALSNEANEAVNVPVSVNVSETVSVDVDVPDNKDSCAELSADADTPRRNPIITLALNDKSEYPVYEEQTHEWAALYPAVDVIQQLRNMKGWLDANPTKRKTKKGILKFINGWLTREQDKGGSGHKEHSGYTEANIPQFTPSTGFKTS